MPEHIEAPATKRKRAAPKSQVPEVPLLYLPGETKEERLTKLYEQWRCCTRCPLGQGLAQNGPHEVVFGDGNPNSDVLIIGEAPGEEEQKKTASFIGTSGQTLNQLLAMASDDPAIQDLVRWYGTAQRNKANVDKFHAAVHDWRTAEFFVTNVVACQPPENRGPTNIEVKECWERLYNIIYVIDPLLIIACGNYALASVTKKKTVYITRMRGQIFDVEYDGRFGKVMYPVMPILHPSFLNRVADWKLPDGNFARTAADLKTAMHLVDFLRNQNYGTPIPTR